MKLRSRRLLSPLGLAGAWLIRLWMGTLRRRVYFAGGLTHPADPRRQRYIYAFWHESMLTPATFRTRIHVLISRHADGELIAQVCRFLGFQVARGSSTRGGVPALLKLYRRTGRTHIAFTPDGPRGPRRRVQPGVIYLASLTGLPIVAAGVGFSKAWRARSWDRFAIPRPFGTSACVIAPPVYVPPGLGRDDLERYRLLVEAHLATATAAAERWALGGPSPARYVTWDAPAVRRKSA